MKGGEFTDHKSHRYVMYNNIPPKVQTVFTITSGGEFRW